MDSMTHASHLADDASRESVVAGAFSILIVDGAMDMRAALLCRRLRRQGYRAEAVDSGRAALRFLEERPVDLVLLGDSRPGMNVLEVLRRFREGHSCAALPVIMMSGVSGEGLAVQALGEGANDWVPRDVDFPSLLARLKPQLETKRRHDDLSARHGVPRGPVELGGAGAAPGGRLHDPRAFCYRSLYEDTPAMFYTVDVRGRMLSVNRFGLSHLGYEPGEVVGTPLCDLCPESERSVMSAQLAMCFADAGIVHAWEIRRRRKDGSVFWSRETARVITDGRGAETALIVAVDNTEAHRMSEELSYQAKHDPLTDLLNRRELERRLRRALASAHTEDRESVLLYLDLDQFKVINDTCGHAAGDELLRRLGVALKEAVAERGTLARLGGDEFGVLLEDCTLAEARRRAEALRERVEDFRFAWEGRVFGIGVSIGMVGIDDVTPTAESALADADSACYVAKDRGRNQVYALVRDDRELSRRVGEMRWQPRLQEALDHDQFVLYQQPIEAAAGGGGGGFYELLVRLCENDGSHIAPGAFLPTAERYGLSPKVDRWVIRRAFEWLHRHPDHMASLAHCSINLSGLSLGDEKMLPFIFDLFERTGLAPEGICFEITETAAISNLASATRFIGALKDYGCSFALDDFGSGLSSFAYLRELPVDYLKIDGVFVRGILEDDVDLAMVQAINDVGQLMGKRTIAEFVETDAIRRRLCDMGVDYVQGHGVGVPALLIP